MSEVPGIENTKWIVACDGTFLYAFNKFLGLFKLGTGLNNTVQGHVYKKQVEFQKEDKSTAVSLTFASGKLFFTSPSFSTSHIEGVENKPNDSFPVRVGVVDPLTLTLEKSIYLSSTQLPPNETTPLFSDGRYLYISYRKSEAPSSNNEKFKENFFVDIYDTTNLERLSEGEEKEKPLLLKSIKLSGSHESSKKTKDAPAPFSSSAQFECGCFYTNGKQLVVLVSSSLKEVYRHSKVFSLPSGNLLYENNLDILDTPSFHTCYDLENNLLWSINNLEMPSVSCWSNFGQKSGVSSAEDSSGSTLLPWSDSPFSPEAFFSLFQLQDVVSSEKPFAQALTPLQLSLLLLFNMDRIARQHPIYSDLLIVDKTNSSPTCGDYFCVEPSTQLFAQIQRVVSLTEELQEAPLAGAILLSCLRIAKVNVFELMCRKKQDSVESFVVTKFKETLYKLIVSPPQALASDPPLAKKVQQEACSVLITGTALFFSNSELLSTLQQLLNEQQNGGKQLLLHLLLQQLAKWENVSDILLKPKDEKQVEMDLSHEEDLEYIEEQRQPQPVEENALPFLEALINFSLKNTLSELERLNLLSGEQPPLPNLPEEDSVKTSGWLKLLLQLQKDIINSGAFKNLLVDYIKKLISQSSSLVERVFSSISTQKPEATPLGQLHRSQLSRVLRSSLLGIVLPSLEIALSRQSLCADIKFVQQVYQTLVPLLSNLDSLNKLFPESQSSDASYLQKLFTGKKERKEVVETAHPYQEGVSNLKKTVTLPGAKFLSIQFDSRSRTANAGADTLQLFRNSSLSQFSSVVGKKDFDPLFSGSHFPKEPLVVEGDSVTFFFNSSSHGGGADRWGFKCTISPFKPSSESDTSIDFWMLDLFNISSSLASKYASTLIAGTAISAEEKKCAPWLQSGHFTGGVEKSMLQVFSPKKKEDSATPSPKSKPTKNFLQALINDSSPADVFYKWLKSKNAHAASSGALVFLEKAERCVVAAMLKHLGLVTEAISFIEMLEKDKKLAEQSESCKKFLAIADEAIKVFTWLNERAQMENSWRVAVSDKNYKYDDFTKYKPEKLMDLCKMKGVEFDLMKTEDTHKRLSTKLKEMIDSPSSQEVSQKTPHQVVCEPVIEKAQFLICLLPTKKVIEYPSAVSSNPFALSSNQQEAKAESIVDDTPIAKKARTEEKKPVIVVKDDTDGGDDDSSEDVPITRSYSHYPQTQTTINRENVNLRQQEKSKALTRRVKELRQWIEAWKNWTEGSLLEDVRGKQKLPRSPLPAVTSFVKSDLSVDEMKKAVEIQSERAKIRNSGLTFLIQLLKFASFGSARHLLLSSLKSTLSHSSHYLINIETCGKSLTQQIFLSFVSLFDVLTNYLKDPSFDVTSRLLALDVCSLSFEDFDAQLLYKSNIFPILQQIVHEVTPLAAKEEIGEAAKDDKGKEEIEMDIEEDDKKGDKKEDAFKVPQQKTVDPKKNEESRANLLKKTAWTAFRLLASVCVSWGKEDIILNRGEVDKVITKVFEVLTLELENISKLLSEQTNITSEDHQHCFEVLSTLYMLATVERHEETAVKVLSKPNVLNGLISILKASLSAPKTKRLVLRLMRYLLPHQSANIPNYISLLLDEIGRWLLVGVSESKKSPKQQEVEMEVDEYKGKQEKSVEKKGERMKMEKSIDIESEETPSKPKPQPLLTQASSVRENPEGEYSLFLHSWVDNPQRLFEECERFSPGFFVNRAVFGNRRLTGTAIVKQLLSELEKKGKVLLKNGSLDECNKLSLLLSMRAATLSIIPSSEVSSAERSKQYEERLKERQNSSNWISGHTAMALVSEYIALLRYLAKLGEQKLRLRSSLSLSSSSLSLSNAMVSPRKFSRHENAGLWSEGIREALSSVLLKGVPKLLGKKGEKQVGMDVLAAFCVIGGFTELMRVGGKVVVTSSEDSALNSTLTNSNEEDQKANKFGIVVKYSQGSEANASIVYESDNSGVIHQVGVHCLEPVSEIEADPNILNPNTTFLRSILSLLNEENKSEEIKESSLWIVADIKARALKALKVLMGNSSFAQLFLSNFTKDYLPLLVDMASACKPTSSVACMEEEMIGIGEKLWNLSKPKTLVLGDSKAIQEILPHYPKSLLSDGLPTCLNLSLGCPGLVFRGADPRVVELYAANTRIFRNKPPHQLEIIVSSKAPIPNSCQKHYFEVAVEKAEQKSRISVGLNTPGSKHWSDQSYRFQADGKVAHFVNAKLERSDYASFFSQGSVVGCLWDIQEGTISFTKDGLLFDVAFGDVPQGVVLAPCIGMSNGVKLRFNFGQEEFIYNPVSAVANDKENEQLKLLEKQKLDEQRKVEEARRKQERQQLKAARKQMALQLTDMGFSLGLARRGLHSTEYQSVEAATEWIFANMEAEPLPDSDEEDDDKKKKGEEVKEAKKEEMSKEKADVPPQESKEDKKAEKELPSPVEVYQPSLSKDHHDSDCYSYTNEASDSKAGVKSVAKIWQELVIPEVRAFMQKERYEKYQIEDHIQQINMALKTNEEQAKEIVNTIFGGVEFKFPSLDNPTSAQPLQIKDIKVGVIVSLIPDNSTEESEEEDSTAKSFLSNLSGTIVSVDFQAEQALVEFYDDEKGVLEQWWCKFSSLTKCDAPSFTETPEQSLLLKEAVETEEELSKLYARQTVLALLSFCPLSIEDNSSLNFKKMLDLLSQEKLACDVFTPTASRSSMALSEQKLRELHSSLTTPEQKQGFANLLVSQCTSLFKNSTKFLLEKSTTVKSEKPIAEKQKVAIEGAKTLLLTFSKDCFLPADCGAKLAIYEDEKCTNLLKAYDMVSSMTPFVVQSDQFYLKVHCEGAQRNNVKYGFTVTPSTPQLSLAMWLVQYIINYSLANSNAQLTLLFNSMLECCYTMNVFSPQKQGLLALLTKLVRNYVVSGEAMKVETMKVEAMDLEESLSEKEEEKMDLTGDEKGKEEREEKEEVKKDDTLKKEELREIIQKQLISIEKLEQEADILILRGRGDIVVEDATPN